MKFEKDRIENLPNDYEIAIRAAVICGMIGAVTGLILSGVFATTMTISSTLTALGYGLSLGIIASSLGAVLMSREARTGGRRLFEQGRNIRIEMPDEIYFFK